MGVGVLFIEKSFHKKGEVIIGEYFMIVAYLVFVNPRNIEIYNKFLRLGFNNIKLKVQKYNICVPLMPLLVYFRNRHQYIISFRHKSGITFWGGGWKGDQSLKYKFSSTRTRKILQEFSSFILRRHVIWF